MVNGSGSFDNASVHVYIVGEQDGRQVRVTPDGRLAPITVSDNGADGFTDHAIPPAAGSDTRLSLPRMSGRIHMSLGQKLKLLRAVTDGNGDPALQYPAGRVANGGPVAEVLGAGLNRSAPPAAPAQPVTDASSSFFFYRTAVTNRCAAAMHAATADGGLRLLRPGRCPTGIRLTLTPFQECGEADPVITGRPGDGREGRTPRRAGRVRRAGRTPRAGRFQRAGPGGA